MIEQTVHAQIRPSICSVYSGFALFAYVTKRGRNAFLKVSHSKDVSCSVSKPICAPIRDTICAPIRDTDHLGNLMLNIEKCIKTFCTLHVYAFC